MGIIGKKLRSFEGGRVAFMCPGCNEMHQVRVREDGQNVSPSWGYNGNPDAPTFTPSILAHFTRLDMEDDELDRVLAEYKLPEDCERLLADKRVSVVCHSFVTDGRIQFLSDCTHALAGQTVDLPDLAE